MICHPVDGRSRNRIGSAILELANKQRKDQQIPPAAGSGVEETLLSPRRSVYDQITHTDKVKLKNAKVPGS